MKTIINHLLLHKVLISLLNLNTEKVQLIASLILDQKWRTIRIIHNKMMKKIVELKKNMKTYFKQILVQLEEGNQF